MISRAASVTKGSRGTTFMELIIIVTLLAVVFGGMAVSLNNVIGSNNKATYTVDIESIQGLIIKARSYARLNRLNDHWGIKELIGNATGCGTSAASNCFVLFKGKDYATRNTNYDEILPFNSNLGRWDDTNNENEIYFQKISGWGRGFDNAYNTDATGFRLRNSDGTYDCTIKVGIFGAVYNSCE